MDEEALLNFSQEKDNKKEYSCPMHPEVKSDKPGKCPECGMSLVEEKSTAAHSEHKSAAHPVAQKVIQKSIFYGLLATLGLLTLYFTTVTLTSGWGFAREQFEQFWYFVVALAIGFGVQVGLYVYLRNLVKNQKPNGKVLAATGTTSTAAMISCCSHYLVNLLPFLGIAGLVTFVSQYQVQFFWVGLAFNSLGIAYMLSRIIKFSKMS